MPFSIHCPSCNAKLRANEAQAGKRFRCPKCSSPVAVPGVESPDNRAPSAAIATEERAVFPASDRQAVDSSLSAPSPSVGKSSEGPAAVRDVQSSQSPHLPSAAAESPFPVIIDTRQRPKPKRSATQSNQRSLKTRALIVSAGATALLLAAVSAASLLSRQKAHSSASSAAASSQSGMLVLHWPPAERKNAKFTIDAKVVPIPAAGRFEISLTPGIHQLVIQRRGFEPVSSDIELVAANELVFTPAWKAVEITAAALDSHNARAATDTPLATAEPPTGEAAEAAATPAPTPVPNAGPAPRGFEGWTQSLAAAKQRAATENKDVLLLFGSSDGSPKTLRLARALSDGRLHSGVLADRYIAVIVDFPQTRAGIQTLLDREQNIELAGEYGITEIESLPVVVLADAAGRPFAIQRDWPAGLEQAAEKLPELAAQKAERDRLLAEAAHAHAESGLKHAAAAAKWLVDQGLTWSYRQEIQEWFARALQADAANVAGHFEIFLEGELFNRLAQVPDDDAVAVAQSLALLDDFLAKKRFHDPDRGFRLHWIAGNILFKCNDQEQALTHLNRAVTYQPKDRELSQQAAAIRRRLGNANVLGNGTAFVVARGGYLLTNRHVVEGPGRLAVQVPGQENPVDVEIVAVDEQLDIALVKAQFPDSLQPRPLPLSPADVRLSASVSAYGFPDAGSLGESLKVTTGTVSALPSKATGDMIVLDVKINPGNSGGPLCDNRGLVVGMVSAKTLSNATVDSYGLAIKAKHLRDFLRANLPKGVQVAPQPKKAEARDWTVITETIQESVFMLIKLRN